MSTTILEANNIKIYSDLSDFAKCCDSRIKSAPQVPQLEGGGGGGGSAILGNAHIQTAFLKMASLSKRTTSINRVSKSCKMSKNLHNI